MTITKTRNAKSAHVHHHDTSATTEEVTMSTNADATKSLAHVTPATPVETVAAKEVTPAPSVPTVFVAAPPSPSILPPVPAGFTPAEPGAYRSVAPRVAELAALPQAITDLRGFANYAQLIAVSAPKVGEVIDAFDLARQWSEMRAASSRWDQFCVVQEGLAWQGARNVSSRLLPAYTLAVDANPELPGKYAGLTSVLFAKKVAAHRAASSRRANREDLAQGKAPSHGKAAQRKQRVAAKALLKATQGATVAQPATAPTATGISASTAVAKAAAATPVTAPGATLANGALPS